jgi:hypothetical protein
VRFLILLAMMCIASMGMAQGTAATKTCQCINCGADCQCDCPAGQCVCQNCPGNTVPAMLSGGRKLSLEEVFGEVGTKAAGSRDNQWHADVEQSLQYLFRRQENILERLAKVEKAVINVRTLSGQTVSRSIPIVSGRGEFQLAPGEVLTGYQDVGTGQWVNAQSQQPAVAYSQAGYPVQSYAAPYTEVRTMAQQGQPVRGAIRVTMGGCRSCG